MFTLKQLFPICFLFKGLLLQAQETVTSLYGLPTVSTMEAYDKMISADSMKKLVDLQVFIPGIALEIRYAGKDNFLHEQLYQSPKAYLNLPAAIALKNVESELRHKGLALKIFDAYRPYAVTVLFYEKVRDTVFVASPYRGSRHNRGSAVDLTLIKLKSRKELVMPTPYDDFSPKAHSNYTNLPRQAVRNRALLKSVMTKYGLKSMRMNGGILITEAGNFTRCWTSALHCCNVIV